MSQKRLLAGIVFLFSFAVLLYGTVWGFDFALPYFKDFVLRRYVILAYTREFLGYGLTPDMLENLRAISWGRQDIADGIIYRAFGSAIAAGCIAAASTLTFPGKAAEKFLRGSRLVTEATLRRRLDRGHSAASKLQRLLTMTGLFSIAIAMMFAVATPLNVLYSAGFGLLLGGGLALWVDWYQSDETEQAPVHIGRVPWPVELECRHLLIPGTTGAGKSQAIMRIVHEARVRGDRGLIADCGGLYVSSFFRQKKDLLLCPGDARSVKWNPFLDIESIYDYQNLARATIPDGTGADAQWNHYGQTLIAAVLKALHRSGDHSVLRLVHLVCNAPVDELQPLLEGSEAEVLTQKANDRFLGSTRAVVSTYLLPWSLLPDGGDFSIKRWIREGAQNQWLFLPYKDNQAATVRSLISAWLQLAVLETLSLPLERCRRTWLIADEFDSLGKISIMRDALTKLRKYRTSCVLGLHSIDQLRSTYGNDEAGVLLSCLSSKLFLRQSDPATARWASEDLGQRQIRRTEKSQNQRSGLDLNGKNETASEHTQTEPLVLPSELSNLPDMVGYLNLAGEHPVAKIKLPFSNWPRVAPAFVDEA